MDKKFLDVRNPSKYIGNEINSCNKTWKENQIKVCLCYPDDYEIGTSSTGFSLLYHLINKKSDSLADRIFAPQKDFELQVESKQRDFLSLNYKKQLNDFDIIGITLPYELTYTNIFNMLHLANIPFLSKDRKNAPLIIGGGSSSFNPEPIADIFDIIVIGDGEKPLEQIIEAVKQFRNNNNYKELVLNTLLNTDGIYVPSKRNKVKKSILPHLEYFPKNPIVPYSTIHARSAIEVARGCTRGCRFCQAGYTYRPIRQRDDSKVLELCKLNLESTGYDELSLLALSVSDYEPLTNVLNAIQSESKSHINSSLPSLRAESLNNELLMSLGTNRAGSFTLAPEAGSERLRKFINKGNTEDDLLKSAEAVFSNGWHRIKLYFMIGLPTETDDDLIAIAELSKKCFEIGRRYHRNKTEVSISASTFIPKPFTPFEREKMILSDEIVQKQNLLKKLVNHKGLSFKGHNPYASQLEGVLSRGGRKIFDVIKLAWEKGARFDAWDEFFSWNIWESAFDDLKIDWKKYLDKIPDNANLPWNDLYTQLDRNFLKQEKDKAYLLEKTADCRIDKCNLCGVCDKNIKNIISKPTLDIKPLEHNITANQPTAQKLRFRFSKTNESSFLGNIEFTSAIKRALIQSKLPIKYSEGFNPHPKIHFMQANPIGMESFAEYMDVDLIEIVDFGNFNLTHLPAGSNLIEFKLLDSNSKPLSSATHIIYKLVETPNDWINKISNFGIELTKADNSYTFKYQTNQKSIIKLLGEILGLGNNEIIPHVIKQDIVFS